MFARSLAVRAVAARTAHRCFSSLVLAEHFEGKLNGSIGSVLSAAAKLNDPTVDVLLHGDNCDAQVEALQKYPGISKILVARNELLQNAYGDSVAKVAQALVASGGYTQVVAAASGFGKDVVPRIGGLMDLQAITDVIEVVEDGQKFKRPVYAGNAVATVSTVDKVKLLTVRATNFAKIEPADAPHGYPVEEVSADLSGVKGKWVKNEASVSESADLASAKFVVSGGRGLKNGENFKMLYDFADALGSQNCAVGASRAAVDAGYVANDLQVGQTGKVVAPDLYVAVGISGAIQHLSGMKDSKVIVAINKDADAPIFKVANYGIVDDLFKVMPELTEKVKA